jgi:hypothetical protein
VLTANLDCGAHVVLEAIGPYESEALNKLELLLLGFRDEERGQSCPIATVAFRNIGESGSRGCCWGSDPVDLGQS